MPKGKKYDAAEKHFLKQKEVLDRTIRQLREQVATMATAKMADDAKIGRLEDENAKLKQANAALQKTAGLTDSEVRSLVKNAESMNVVSGLLRGGFGVV